MNQKQSGQQQRQYKSEFKKNSFDKSTTGIRLTTARYYTPSGESIQGKGIDPDIVIVLVTLFPLSSSLIY